MKTKTKILALVEIAVVLCSVLLVALPAIATEQTSQEVSASASTTTTASEGDYVLEIYGNANEDDTIDMRDLTYVKLIFFGKKPEAELADAKYDGKINPLDFIQIKLIIVGKEKEITIVDSMEKIVTVKKPIKRVVTGLRYTLEYLRAIKVPEDKIVGVPSTSVDYDIYFAEYKDKPRIGSAWTHDCEAILHLHPDVVFLIASPGLRGSASVDQTSDVLESAGITVIRLWSGVQAREIVEETKKLGYIFDRRDEAEEFLDWYKGIMNSIKEKAKDIPEDDKPKVYYEGTKPYSTYPYHIEATGGKDIFEGMSGNIDPEAVIERNPDIIVRITSCTCMGDEVTGYSLYAEDTAGIEGARKEIISRPELQNVKAVKTGRVYVISGYLSGSGPQSGPRYFLQLVYNAKWFHSELFEDLDPKAIHQEYLTRFQGLDIDLDKKGVFVYHPEEHPGGN